MRRLNRINYYKTKQLNKVAVTLADYDWQEKEDILLEIFDKEELFDMLTKAMNKYELNDYYDYIIKMRDIEYLFDDEEFEEDDE